MRRTAEFFAENRRVNQLNTLRFFAIALRTSAVKNNYFHYFIRLSPSFALASPGE